MGSELFAQNRRKPVQPEERNIDAGLDAEGEVSENFADCAGEFKAVPGTGTGNDDTVRFGVEIENKMSIRRVRVQTDSAAEERSISPREKAVQHLPHRGDILGVGGAIGGIGMDQFALVMEGYFHAGAEVGKAVEHSVRLVFPEMNWEVLRCK